MHFTLQAEYILQARPFSNDNHYVLLKERYWEIIHFDTQELSKKAVGREESFQNGIGVPESEDGRNEDHDPESDTLKRKKVRATTGDLAKFLRTEQEQGKTSEFSSPHHMLHPDQMMSNTASLYSMNTDVTGVTGMYLLKVSKTNQTKKNKTDT